VIPLDYLRVTRRGKEIKPAYLSDVSAAAEVLEAARGAKTLGDFRKAVRRSEGTGSYWAASQGLWSN